MKNYTLTGCVKNNPMKWSFNMNILNKIRFNTQSTSDILGAVMIIIFTAFFFAAGFTDWFLI